ncbi:hypothetical protein GBAR_LOCUS23628 [Geodia barretti]|uniref:Uncharacterized protein n=1 Tax=Geodia barretti TaxID=519541 RepID=A0AA35X3C8_GEOBA|nr:hypothetical protein GBAR_LOCUS23628 [Geodia barretti]
MAKSGARRDSPHKFVLARVVMAAVATVFPGRFSSDLFLAVQRSLAHCHVAYSRK